MSEKISYLNVFFQHDKECLPALTSEELADYIPALIFVFDTETNSIRYGNRKFVEFTGRKTNSLFQWRNVLTALFHPADHGFVHDLLDADERHHRAMLGDRTVRLCDGQGRYLTHRLQVNIIRRRDNGQPHLILFIAEDITDLLKSKEEIETTRELLDETEELLQFGSWAWDVSTNTVSWTSGLYSLMEYSREEVAGKVGLDFYFSHVLEENVEPLRDRVRHALEDKADFSYEYVIRTRSGALKNISTRGRVVTNERGEVIKVLCINRDITALRSFEKEQERSIRELNRSNRDLEEFAYIASHDLQEPLRKISMFTERLKAKYDKALDQEGELFIERILLSAANMRTLIDNLLEFSRTNRRSYTLDQVSLEAVLENVISELELKIEETGAKIDISGHFPVVQAATSEMKQLFGNILSNAIKFRKKEREAHVRVRAARLSQQEKQALGLAPNKIFYKVEIEDNGIGFEPEYSEKIFQVFQRLNGKSEYPGSGIGLAICKKIVEKHNGLIFARSQPEQGATFTVVLPEKQF